jgi:endoglucanase
MENLNVRGVELCSGNKPIVLNGISSHGLSWYPQYINQDTLDYFIRKWHINAFRLAMYTAEDNGYCTLKEENRQKLIALVKKGINLAIKNNIYVIVDWHILSDYNPLMHKKEAEDFFSLISSQYKNTPNIIYEICNEPNMDTTWEQIREYAEDIIPLIRKNAKENLIVVGTPCWSQNVDEASLNPLSYSNLMYALHFYSSTHGKNLMEKIDTALMNHLPIFVSEFGISPASGNGKIDFEKSREWLSFIKERNLSHFAWALSNRDETCAFIKPACQKLKDFTKEDLTECGLFLEDYYSHS